MEQTINKQLKTADIKAYMREYYANHKDTMLKNAKNWREINSGNYVYFLVDENGQYIYTGSYDDRPIIERLSFHMGGKSNLNMTAKELAEKYNISLVVYKNFKKYGLNKQDLHFIENYFKENYKNILGSNKVKYNEKMLSKSKEELIQIAEEEELQFFNFDKYLN